MNRYERRPPAASEAQLLYQDGDFRVLRPGLFVLCAVTGVQIYVGTSAGHEAATPLPSSAYAESAQLRGPRQYLITVKVTHLSARPYYFRVSSSDTAGTSPKSAEVVAAVT